MNVPLKAHDRFSLNGLLKAERRGRIDDREVRRRLAGFLQESPIKIADETASTSWTTTAILAEQHRLTIYDATYLELAVRRGVPLATSDTALIAAAKVVGVQLLLTT